MIFPFSHERPLPATSLVGFLLATLLLAGLGCSKAKKSGTAPPAEVVNQQANDHMPAQGQPPTAVPAQVAQPASQPDLAELNRSLLRWVLRNKRRPNSFEDFAATAGVAIPPAPAGKKYVIGSDMHIKLVNQ